VTVSPRAHRLRPACADHAVALIAYLPRRIQAWRELNELSEADQIEPGDADGDREGSPAQQMETR
jgi:hypothetical protein